MVAALLDGTYAIEVGSEVPNAIGLSGFRLEAKMPRAEIPLPTISFRTLNSPITPPHDPIRTAIRCLRAPVIGSADAKRVKDALTASACQSCDRATGRSRPDDTLIALAATPWSGHSVIERDGDTMPWSDVEHDGSVEALLPQVVQISRILGPGGNGASTVLIHPMRMVVNNGDVMDPMETMRTIVRLERMPIRSRKR